MNHTNQQVRDWIFTEWANDYFRFEDVAAELEVSRVILLNNKTLEVSLSVIGDETQNGNTSTENVLFIFDPEFHSGCFPKLLQLVHLKIRYTWPSENDCEHLSSAYDEETIELEIDNISWDDPRLTDSAVETILANTDQFAIADTLLRSFDGDNGVPSFIPKRLKPYFKQYIEEFHLQNKE